MKNRVLMAQSDQKIDLMSKSKDDSMVPVCALINLFFRFKGHRN